jgi:hypothetical protein
MFLRERSSETMIPDTLLAIRKPSTLVYLMFYFHFFKPHKKYHLIITFILLNLQVVMLPTTPVNSGHKNIVYHCRLIEEYMRKNRHYPREVDINPRVMLAGKTFLAASLYAWSPTSGKFIK